jgi:hypothetical protein
MFCDYYRSIPHPKAPQRNGATSPAPRTARPPSRRLAEGAGSANACGGNPSAKPRRSRAAPNDAESRRCLPGGNPVPVAPPRTARLRVNEDLCCERGSPNNPVRSGEPSWRKLVLHFSTTSRSSSKRAHGDDWDPLCGATLFVVSSRPLAMRPNGPSIRVTGTARQMCRPSSRRRKSLPRGRSPASPR